MERGALGRIGRIAESGVAFDGSDLPGELAELELTARVVVDFIRNGICTGRR